MGFSKLALTFFENYQFIRFHYGIVLKIILSSIYFKISHMPEIFIFLLVLIVDIHHSVYFHIELNQAGILKIDTGPVSV